MFLLVVAGAFAFFWNIQHHRVFSSDGYDPYYHMGMSKVVMEKGVAYHENWLEKNIFETAYGNTLLGFHVLGAAALALSPGLSVFWVSEALVVCLAVAVLSLVYALGKSPLFKAGIVAFLLSSAAAVYRMSVFRPQLLGYLFFFLTLFALMRRRRGLLFVALLSHMLAHTSFPFSVVLVVLYLLLTRDWDALNVLVVAALAFFLLHPDATAIVVRQQLQVVDIPFGAVQKGAEWMAVPTTAFVTESGPLLLISFLAVLHLLSSGVKSPLPVVLSLSAIPMFFYAAAQHGRFQADLVLVLAAFCMVAYDAVSMGKKQRHQLSALVAAVALFVLWPRVPLFESADTSSEALRLNTAIWLAENSLPSHVLNDWDAFPVLFYENTYGYSYAAGLDPMYLYHYSPTLYSQYMEVMHTVIPIETRYQAVTRIFGADYVVLDDTRLVMEQNPYFDLVLLGKHAVLKVRQSPI